MSITASNLSLATLGSHSFRHYYKELDWLKWQSISRYCIKVSGVKYLPLYDITAWGDMCLYHNQVQQAHLFQLSFYMAIFLLLLFLFLLIFLLLFLILYFFFLRYGANMRDLGSLNCSFVRYTVELILLMLLYVAQCWKYSHPSLAVFHCLSC